MILAIDMGNTRIKWRVSNELGRLAEGFIGTTQEFDLLSGQVSIFRESLKRILVSNVLGVEAEKKFTSWCFRCLAIMPEFARSKAFCCGVINGYSHQEQLGVDRWLALVAAYNRTHRASVVISCGTSITVDLIKSNGEHLGGYIAPGLKLILGALNDNARLIAVDPKRFESTLNPGRSTSDAVYAAATAMIAGLVDNALKQMRDAGELDSEVLFAGGDAEQLISLFPSAKLAVDLVFDGLDCAMRS